MRRFIQVICAVLCIAGACRGAGDEPVLVEFFFELGCEDCERIEEGILPVLEERLGVPVDVQKYDLGVKEDFILLLRRMDSSGYDGEERAYLVLNKTHAFGSPLNDPDAFFEDVKVVLADRTQVVPQEERSGEELLESEYEDITLLLVLIAGLSDGVNPCAISTLVFFMSLLAVSKIRKRQLLGLGIAFCTASFLTYFILGLTLLRVLHLFSGVSVLQLLIKWVMTLLLLVLAVLSFRDAFRFHKHQQAKAVTLQLSDKMKKRIHAVMRRGLGLGSVVVGGVLIGVSVTLLESVCTGQVLVPTLAFVLENSGYVESKAWGYLLIYNLMFILPLIIVFIAVYFGLRTETLLAWSRKNVVVSKVLLGGFFLLLAGLFLWF